MSGSPDSLAPSDVYKRRLAALNSLAARLERQHATHANLRIVAFLAILACAWGAFSSKLHPFSPAVPAAAFLVLVVRHDAILMSLRRARRGASFYERGIARLEDRPVEGGIDGSVYADPSHPNAADLDLFGPGSLFHVLNGTRTRGGAARLASWLQHPATPETIRERQDAVRRMQPAIELREDLAVLADEVQAGVHADELVAWCSRGDSRGRTTRTTVGLLLAAAAVAGVSCWIFGVTGGGPLLLVVLAQLVYRRACRDRVKSVAARSDLAARDLKLLSELLDRLEGFPPSGVLLHRLNESLKANRQAPSRAIRRLDFLVDCFEARRNGLFAPIAFLLLWDVLFAEAIDLWRSSHRGNVSTWLDAVAEFEALSSISGYAYERPDEVFPTVLPSPDGPLFDAAALGHPLLPRSHCVRNDVRLDQAGRLLIVSGSNMSGKSTLLRSIGLAAAMAQAGGPVRATRLAMSSLQVGASIRVQDSLREGTSRFYAEIQRLRQIVAMSEEMPALLFLVDEILQGTNSHDRRTGVEAVLRSLLERTTLGLITTHDLALTELSSSLGQRVRNVHFEDHMEDGRMAFDYLLRDGVVQKSNAIQLMRAVGLAV